MPATATKPSNAVQIEKLLYRRKDAAFALSLSVRTIDRLISDHVLTTRRLRGCVVIPAADVKRFAATVGRCDMLQGTASERPKESHGEGPRRVRTPKGKQNLVVSILRPRQTP